MILQISEGDAPPSNILFVSSGELLLGGVSGDVWLCGQ